MRGRVIRLLKFATIICSGFFIFSTFALADSNSGNTILITQIQVSGTTTTTDEFIELYNPNSFPIDMTNWKLTKKTAGGTETALVGSFTSTSTINAHGYFLIAHRNYFGETKPDTYYTNESNSIANDNTIILYDGSIPTNIINKVGLGKVNDYQTATTTNPNKGESLGRISTDDGYQNLENNFLDFTTSTPNPHNTNSPIFPPIDNLLPTAEAGPNQEANIGNEIIFDGSNSTDTDGFIKDYQWDFGDGVDGTGVITTHTYTSVGNFTATLTITDDRDATSSDNILITITSAPTTTPTTTPTSTPYEAKPSDIVINEFLSSPETGQNEWVELYNNTTSSIDLSGWSISDTVSPTVMTGTIGAETATKFFVVEFNSGKLNNSGDAIILKNKNGQVIDQIYYGEIDGAKQTISAPDKNNAMALTENGNTTSGFKETITPTKSAANIITSPPAKTSNYGSSGTTKSTIQTETTSTTATTTETITFSSSTKIIINELLPRPSQNEATDEFIELKNMGTSTANLSGWILTDKTGKKYKIPNVASSTISAGAFLVVYRASSSIALNNSGIEIVNLYAPDGTIMDSVEYLGPTEKAYSWSRDDKDEFQWTSLVTPEQENRFSPDEESNAIETLKTTTPARTTKATVSSARTNKTSSVIEVPIEQTHNLGVGQKVKTRGVVSVLPGILGTQIFYLAGSGIQIYCNKKDFPTLKLGDLIEVNGEISEASGEKRIKITTQKDIKIISSGPDPTPEDKSGSDITPELVGSLIKTKGTIIQIKGSYIYIDDGAEETKIYIKTSTGISAKDLNLKEGDQIEVTGIISNSASGIRILPRTINDIKKIGEVKAGFEEATTSNQTIASNKYLWVIIVFLGIIIGFLTYKTVRKK